MSRSNDYKGADERAISGHSSNRGMNRVDTDNTSRGTMGRTGSDSEMDGKAPRVPFAPKQLPSAASKNPPGAHPPSPGGPLSNKPGKERSAGKETLSERGIDASSSTINARAQARPF